MPRKLTQDEFEKRLNIINPNIEIVGKYIGSREPIICRCKYDGCEWNTIPCNLIHKTNPTGCPICNGGTNLVIRGINSLWDTNPEIACLLENKELGYSISKGMRTKVNWICPDCGQLIIGKSIGQISQNGLSCFNCDDYMSYAEKFLIYLLRSLNVRFDYQKSFKWSNRKIYDFYIQDIDGLGNDCIIETHGEQHYTQKFKIRNANKIIKLCDEIENDEYKKNIALENNTKYYIVLDCRKSKIDWIKSSIMKSDLNSLLRLETVNWEACGRYSSKSIIYEICNYRNNGYTLDSISSTVKISKTSIKYFISEGKRLGLCGKAVVNG